MKFGIVIQVDGKLKRLRVERIYHSDQIEKYIVVARNKTLTFRSNRPLLRKKGLKHRRPDWKLVDGQIHNRYVLEIIVEELQKYLNRHVR
ncbi:MAG: hypothetical protein H6549_12840 [Chitinophagales bacterium]|nr:hypothetical protein [Chitinophagales bacterium]